MRHMEELIIEVDELEEETLPINRIIHGDALEVLRKLPSNSVDCVITSPPYYSQRCYPGTERVWDGDPECEHEWRGQVCLKCGAWQGQLGLESSPELYVEHLIQIFAEVKRVLQPHGNCFVIIDDTYAGGSGWNSGGGLKYKVNEWERKWVKNTTSPCPTSKIRHIPRKSLCLVPELFAIRMVYDLGFILRSKIVWAKRVFDYAAGQAYGCAMPSSVQDRLNDVWEYVYHFTKEPHYWFDLDAVRIPLREGTLERAKGAFISRTSDRYGFTRERQEMYYKAVQHGYARGANPGDVVFINPESSRESHYAQFPTRLVQFLIKIGCPHQVCKKCGKPRHRVWVKHRVKDKPNITPYREALMEAGTKGHWGLDNTDMLVYEYKGWSDCGCNAGWRAGLVLDPFFGSGTTGLVALQMGRDFIGIELSEEYCKMAANRLLPYVRQQRLDDLY